MFEDIVSCFRSMPQTSSAIALWLVKLDSILAARLIEGPEVGVSKGMMSEKFLLLDETFKFQLWHQLGRFCRLTTFFAF